MGACLSAHSTAAAEDAAASSAATQPAQAPPVAVAGLSCNEDARARAAASMALDGLRSVPAAAQDLRALLRAARRALEAAHAGVVLFGADAHAQLLASVGADDEDEGAAALLGLAARAHPLLAKQAQTLVVPDTALDARTAAVAAAGRVFGAYACSPLLAGNGHRVGALCVAHPRPRALSAAECRLLNNLAELAARSLERHARVQERLALARCAYALEDRTPEHDPALAALMMAFAREVRRPGADAACTLLLDTWRTGWPVLYCSDDADDGSAARRRGRPLAALVAPAQKGRYLCWPAIQRDAALGGEFLLSGLRWRRPWRGAEGAAFQLAFRPAALTLLDEDALLVGVPPTAVLLERRRERCSRYYAARLRPSASASAGPAAPTPPRPVVGEDVRPPHAVVPQFVAGVKLRHVLGRGALGTAYHATWQGRSAVVKVQDYRVRTRRELEDALAEVSAGLRFHHPNLVETRMHSFVRWAEDDEHDERQQVHLSSLWRSADFAVAACCPPDEEAADGAPLPCTIRTFLVVEFCGGGALQDALDRGAATALTAAQALALALDVARGLRALHAEGAVHGDLSACNVMLQAHVAKLADFGRTRLAGAAAAARAASYASLAHLAPEVLADGRVSAASDMYAFGVLLWQLCCGGRRPWAGLSHEQVVAAAATTTGALVFPDRDAGRLPAMADLGRACLALDPGRRPTSDQACAALERAALESLRGLVS